MPHGLFQSLSGREGEFRIPALGALIATMNRWTLTRRGEDYGATERLYDLRAVFSYVNPNLWDDPDYQMVCTIKIGTNQFKLTSGMASQPRLEGNGLLWEGVELVKPDQGS
jgi:hypothetical protein